MNFPFLVQLPLESVPEEPDEDSGLELNSLQREVSTPNVRIPSQSARATLVRTPATREKTTSPLVFNEEEEEEKTDDEKNILITEIQPTEYQEVQFEVDVEHEDSLSDESVELKDLVVEPIGRNRRRRTTTPTSISKVRTQSWVRHQNSNTQRIVCQFYIHVELRFIVFTSCCINSIFFSNYSVVYNYSVLSMSTLVKNARHNI